MSAPTRLWSNEAEQSVLGAMLLDPERAVARLADQTLTAADFFDQRHARLWEAATAMQAAGQAVDVVTVIEHLRAAGVAEQVGGLAYLNALVQSVPSANAAGSYAALVRDFSLRRALVDAAGQVADIAAEPGKAADAIERAAALFSGLERGNTGTVPRALGELVSERLGHWQAMAEGTLPPGVSTGLVQLDEALSGGLKPGRVIVLAARPSVGKTSLATQLGISVAMQGHGVLLLSQEMPAADLVDRIVSNLGRLSLGNLAAGAMTDDDFNRLAEGCDSASALPLLLDDTPALTLGAIRTKARQAQRKHTLALVIVDYLQLCSASGRQDTRHHQIEEISRGLKALAKELGVTVLALSQFNRGAAEREPELSDLKESGAIEEDADTVILLHPMEQQPDGALVVLAKLAKNRQGRRGRLALELHGGTQRWKQSSCNVSRRRPGGSE